MLKVVFLTKKEKMLQKNILKFLEISNRIKFVLKTNKDIIQDNINVNFTEILEDSVKLNVKATGGSGNYTYKYVVYNTNTKVWYTLKDLPLYLIFKCKIKNTY